MDLGAGICIPNGAPKCSLCPISPQCEAYRKGTQTELPVKAAAKRRRIEQRTVLIIEKDRRILLHKRKDKGLLADLWELPNYDGEWDEAMIRKELAERDLTVASLERIESAKHIFSHIEWHMSAYLIKAGSGQKITDIASLSEEPATYTMDNQKKEPLWVFVDSKSLETEYALPSAFNAFRKYL